MHGKIYVVLQVLILLVWCWTHIIDSGNEPSIVCAAEPIGSK